MREQLTKREQIAMTVLPGEMLYFRKVIRALEVIHEFVDSDSTAREDMAAAENILIDEMERLSISSALRIADRLLAETEQDLLESGA